MKKFTAILAVLFTLGLFLPVTGTFAASATANESSQVMEQKINVNTAGEEMLVQVPGIGPKTAQKIVAYRNDHGAFQQLDDLTGVKGIGQKSLSKMKPYLTL